MNKKLIISFLISAFLICSLCAGINYYTDPYHYFRYKEGVITEIAPGGSDKSERQLCAHLLKNSPEGTYDGIIVGGSKSRLFSPEQMKHYTGDTYLSCSVAKSDINYFENIIKYAWKTQKIKKVLLNIGSPMLAVSLPDSEQYRMPALLEGKPEINDILYYLSCNTGKNIKNIVKGETEIPSIEKRFKKGQRLASYSPDAKENHTFAEYFGILDDSIQKDSWIGPARLEVAQKRGISAYYDKVIEGGEDARIAWTDKYVKNEFGPYDASLHKLFYDTPDLFTKDETIEGLKRIKEFCDQKGIELTVVSGAQSIVERSARECEEYWSFLRETAKITDFYDFGYYCDINNNLYNFYDGVHHIDSVSWLMLDSIYGKNDYEYGVYLTKDNIHEYLAERERAYYELKKEYDSTGTLKLPGIGDKSDLAHLPNEFYDKLSDQKGEYN